MSITRIEPSPVTKEALAGGTRANEYLDQWIDDVVSNRAWGFTNRAGFLVQQVRSSLALTLRDQPHQLTPDPQLFVYAFTARSCISFLREQYRPPDIDCIRHELELESYPGEAPGSGPVVDERRVFFQIFHALPDACRRLWQLIFLRGQTFADISDHHHIEEAQVRAQWLACSQHAIALYSGLTSVPGSDPGTKNLRSHQTPGVTPGAAVTRESMGSLGLRKGCRTISELLPLYIKRLLATSASQRVAQHVSSCATCSLELADLRCFSEAIERHGPVLLEDHPTPERLVATAWSQATIDPRECYRLTRHLGLCRPCRLEHTVLLRVSESLGISAPARPQTPIGLMAPSSEEMAPRQPLIPSSRSGQRRWWLVAGIAASLVLTAAMFFKPALFPGTPSKVSNESIVVRRHYPLSQVTAPPRSLSWSIVSGAKAYRIVLYDSHHRIMWRSRRIRTTSLMLPPDVADRFKLNRTYYWQVIVKLGRGHIVRSPLFQFTIRQLSQSRPM